MTKLEELKKWEATGAAYNKGVHLCEKHKIRPELMEVFKNGASKGNKRLLLQILIKEIEKLSATGEPETPKKQKLHDYEIRTKLTQNFGMKAKYPNLKINDAPDFIKVMFTEAIGSWNEAINKHDGELLEAETDEQRFALMKEIMKEIDSNDAAHKELRHFNDTGEILGEHPKFAALFQNPQNETPDSSDKMSGIEKEYRAMEPAALLMKRNNLRSQISKVKKALEANPEDEEKKIRLTELEAAEKLASSILDEVQ